MKKDQQRRHQQYTPASYSQSRSHDATQVVYSSSLSPGVTAIPSAYLSGPPPIPYPTPQFSAVPFNAYFPHPPSHPGYHPRTVAVRETIPLPSSYLQPTLVASPSPSNNCLEMLNHYATLLKSIQIGLHVFQTSVAKQNTQAAFTAQATLHRIIDSINSILSMFCDLFRENPVLNSAEESSSAYRNLLQTYTVIQKADQTLGHYNTNPQQGSSANVITAFRDILSSLLFTHHILCITKPYQSALIDAYLVLTQDEQHPVKADERKQQNQSDLKEGPSFNGATTASSRQPIHNSAAASLPRPSSLDRSIGHHSHHSLTSPHVKVEVGIERPSVSRPGGYHPTTLSSDRHSRHLPTAPSVTPPFVPSTAKSPKGRSMFSPDAKVVDPSLSSSTQAPLSSTIFSILSSPPGSEMPSARDHASGRPKNQRKQENSRRHNPWDDRREGESSAGSPHANHFATSSSSIPWSPEIWGGQFRIPPSTPSPVSGSGNNSLSSSTTTTPSSTQSQSNDGNPLDQSLKLG